MPDEPEALPETTAPIEATIMMAGDFDHMDKDELADLRSLKHALVLRFESADDLKRVLSDDAPIKAVWRWEKQHTLPLG